MRGITVLTFESYLESDSLLAEFYNEFLKLPCFTRKLRHDPCTQRMTEPLRPPPIPVVKQPSRTTTHARTLTQPPPRTPAPVTSQQNTPDDAARHSRSKTYSLGSQLAADSRIRASDSRDLPADSRILAVDSEANRLEMETLQDSVLRDWCLKNRVPLFLKSHQYREYKLCLRIQRRATSRLSRSCASESTTSRPETSSPEKDAPIQGYQPSHGRYVSAPTRLYGDEIAKPSEGAQSVMTLPAIRRAREARPSSLPSADGGRSIAPELRKQVSMPTLPVACDDERAVEFAQDEATEADRALDESPHSMVEEEEEEELVDFDFFMGRKSILEFKEEIINLQYEDGISEAVFDEEYLSTWRGMCEFKTFLEEHSSASQIFSLWCRIERYRDYLREVRDVKRKADRSNKIKKANEELGNTFDKTFDTISVYGESGESNDDDGSKLLAENQRTILDSYLDEVTSLEHLSLKQIRVHLLRTIQQIFNKQLTEDARGYLRDRARDAHGANEFIKRVQYDVLTRLHGYWLQRFLLHCQKACGDLPQLSARPGTSLTFFPSLHVERYLQLPSDATAHAPLSSRDYEYACVRDVAGMTLEESVRKAEDKSAIELAFSVEIDAGCPFLTWLTLESNAEEFEHETNLFRMWLEVDSLRRDVKESNDRLLNVGSAWKIYLRYFNHNNYSLTTKSEVEKMYEKLINYSEFTKNTVQDLFGSSQKHAIEQLDASWQQFRTADNDDVVKHAYDVMTKEVEDEFTDTPAPVKRVKGSKGSKRSNSRTTKLSSRVSREAYSRALTGSPPKRAASTDASSIASFDSDAQEALSMEEQFIENADNPERMTQFSLYIQQNEGRDALNKLNLFLETDAYYVLAAHPQKAQVKDATARGIYQTYFDEESRKHVELPKHVMDVVEDDRPSTPFFSEVQHHVLPHLNNIFRDFEAERQGIIKAEEAKKILDQLELKVEEKGKIKPKGSGAPAKKVSKKPSQKQLSVIEEAPALGRRISMLGGKNTNPKKKKVFGQSGGTAAVTREDRQEFANVSSSYAEISNSDKIEKFRKYLMHMYEPDGLPKLEKDLLFYIEVMRFKDMHATLEDEDLVRKVEVIIDVFLDSASPPWLQIDVLPEMASRAIQRANQCYPPVKKSKVQFQTPKSASDEKKKDVKDANLFDEAQAAVLKELLPFWSGFLKATASKHGKERKITTAKFEKHQRVRYEHFKKHAEIEFPYFVSSPAVDLSLVTAFTGQQDTTEAASDDPLFVLPAPPARSQLHFSVSSGHIWKEPAEQSGKKISQTRRTRPDQASNPVVEKASQTAQPILLNTTAIRVN